MTEEAKRAYRACAGYTLIAIENILDRLSNDEDGALPAGCDIEDLEEYHTQIMNDITENPQ
ncbi:MAG: hypothetical protein CR977_00090 [Gammaproteobacteria bacterium]|nr:MAG: hypothetical protein CR977_00090 [Gammaproteobacteria bacterium]